MGDIAITKLTENLVNCWVGDTTIVDGVVKIPTENWGATLKLFSDIRQCGASLL